MESDIEYECCVPLMSGVACHGKRRGVMVEIGLMVVRSVGVGSNRVGRKDVRWLYEGSLRCEEGRESSLAYSTI